jgi:hypothetical protein
MLCYDLARGRAASYGVCLSIAAGPYYMLLLLPLLVMPQLCLKVSV